MKVRDMQKNNPESIVTSEKNLKSQEIKIYGLYDPQDYGLDIEMWLNSDGDQLKSIFKKLNKMKLSKDANEILNIVLLTNAQSPQKNIKEKELDENETISKIKDVLDTKIRPAVARDGGDIKFKSFENGVVRVELQGACSGCPSSVMTLKQGVQNLLKHYVKEVNSVEAV